MKVMVIALVALSVVLLLNLLATVRIARSDFESPMQKLAQLVLVWLVPCLGSISVIAVHKSAHSQIGRASGDDSSSTRTWLPGSGPESDGPSSHHGGHDAGGGGGQ
jgi:hypothetical protein